MFNRISIIATGVTLACGMVGVAHASVTAEEAKMLGTVLTPTGAVKEGNKEGTIPACCERIPVPANFDPKKRADPFAKEKPLFSISAKNIAQYADKVSEGYKALMQKYPTFRMDIYPSHRTAAHTQFVLDNTLKNATRCSSEKGGVSISKACYGGYPFPIPKTGFEVMWNHLIRDDFFSAKQDSISMVVDPSGKAVLTGRLKTTLQYPYYDPSKTQLDGEFYFRYRDDYIGPPRAAGNGTLFLDTIDPTVMGRRAWSYLPGQRRVKLAPEFNYDTPSPTSNGVYTLDDASVFLGPMDRFDFKLIGKKEMFIPYHNFKMNVDPVNCSVEKSHTKDHLNPDCFRFELHRVWVVEAKLLPGFRHTSPRRVFFWDEDTFTAGLSDNYDAAGKLQKFMWNSYTPMYEVPNCYGQMFGGYDLNSGAYTSAQATPEATAYPSPREDDRFWTSEALAGGGIR